MHEARHRGAYRDHGPCPCSRGKHIEWTTGVREQALQHWSVLAILYPLLTDHRRFCHPACNPLPGAPNNQIYAAFAVQLNSPVAPTGEVLKALKDIGRAVGHIVLPNGSPEHWYFGPAMAAAFPEATVWVAPGQLHDVSMMCLVTLNSCCSARPCFSALRPRPG